MTEYTKLKLKELEDNCKDLEEKLLVASAQLIKSESENSDLREQLADEKEKATNYVKSIHSVLQEFRGVE